MLNYLICFPQLERRVNAIWDNQFEVKAGKENNGFFSLKITQNNEEKYTSCDHFATLEDCDIKNTELREVMKRSSYYCLGDGTGTHWVNVFNFHGRKIFQSVSLHSEEEAKELIEESINNIPDCKYDRG